MPKKVVPAPLTDEELFVLSRRFLSDKIAAGARPEEKFVPWEPHPKQKLFLNIEHDEYLNRDPEKPAKFYECLFGGATGGAKSVALLMAALKYVHVPNYSALLLRRNFPDLTQEGGLLALSQEWLNKTPAKWSEINKTWTFPSGATLRFGYLDTENAKYRYAGGEYQFIGFDELTQFTESQYKFLFSRLRRRGSIPVPLRMVGATNPGGVGGQWVYDRFIPEDFKPAQATDLLTWYKEGSDGHTVSFIPSMLDDNPSLDRESYLQSLMQLDEVTRQQYLNGDWQIQIRGDILYTYSEPHTVISWSQFEKVFGTRQIPSHWKVGIFQDVGQTEAHPCATSWFATAAANSPVVDGVPTAGMVFLYRGLLETRMTARDMSKKIRSLMGNEQSQCMHWHMSHEAASERMEYNKQGLPFAPWKTGRTRGIEQLKNAFSLVHNDRPNPFKESLKGHPRLFLIVDEEELVYAKTDKGLARWRAEILAYHWNTLKSGEPVTRLVPYPLFNDAVDTMRAAAAEYWPISTEKTLNEKILDVVEKTQPMDFVQTIEDEAYKSHVLSQRSVLAAQAREKLQEADKILAGWADIG